MNATMRVIVWGAIPLGALAGGGLTQVIGLRPTLVAGALGVLLAGGWIVFSPIGRRLASPALDAAPDFLS
jgi:predicted MFS family arabinose efflux permease